MVFLTIISSVLLSVAIYYNVIRHLLNVKFKFKAQLGTPRHRKFDRNTVPWEIGTAHRHKA